MSEKQEIQIQNFLSGSDDPYDYAVHYQSANPVAKWLIGNFMHSLTKLIKDVKPQHILEVGCGEGYVALHMAANGCRVHGGDYRAEAIEIAKKMARDYQLSDYTSFEEMDIYAYDFEAVKTDLVVCCEVFEHLPDTSLALKRIVAANSNYFLFSVPGEPWWRALNIMRLKYLKDFGNTPGHINHWNYSGFRKFLSAELEVIKWTRPLPWNMVLCKKRDSLNESPN